MSINDPHKVITDDDMVLVRRGLLAAACGAIRRFMPAVDQKQSNTLRMMRKVAQADGIVPLRIEFEPGQPEDFAFGTQRQMDRLQNWLGKFFVLRAAAPWPDFKGQTIRHGDRLTHPDGNEFTAIRLHGHDNEGDAWRAVYDDATVSRLGLQIADKGQAVVAAQQDECEAKPLTRFVTYLNEHCIGQTITEESLTEWMLDVLDSTPREEPKNPPKSKGLFASSAHAGSVAGDTLRWAAGIVQLYDDATMAADYMVDANDVEGILKALGDYADRFAHLESGAPVMAVPLDDYHVDRGSVVWFAWDAERKAWLGEPAWIGQPDDSDWPGYHTHFIPHPEFPAALSREQTAR